MIKIESEELENFLYYLLDKIEDCYYVECKKSINNFLERNKKN